MLKRPGWFFALIAFCAAAPAAAQTVIEGIPIQSELVQQRCGSCHRADEQQRMSRISYRRASPENWERTVKRMITVNHVSLEPADARAIIKYLADHNGLAPEEVRPIAFEFERRMVDYTYQGDKVTADTCSSCHSIARVLSERRTKEEWELLMAMHRGYYPLVDNQPMNGGAGFRRTRAPQTEPAPDGSPADNRQPMERALTQLSSTLPLQTPEWTAWSAAMQPPRLAGTWAMSGYEAGKGPVFGRVTIVADPSTPDAFTTEICYTEPRGGQTIIRKGKATVFTGFQWRGRADASGGDTWREVMFLERNGREMWGRWFSGAYDETGVDVTLVRIGADPIVTGTSAMSLKTGTTNGAVRIFGQNLPTTITAGEVSLGSGITVSKIVSAAADEITIEALVSASAPPGPRDISMAGAIKPAALIVYDRVDGIKVLPDAGLARLGGAVFPKQLQQFEAIAYNNGPDGKPNTKDDWNLGPVDAKWSMEEYAAVFGDDDLKWVGAVDKNGLFTPNVDGPNPQRSGNRNNVGDVYLVADYTPPGGAKAMRARSFLLVTVPVYMNWYTAEVGR